jgi:tryptophanyl-tRNA synthetase
MDKRTRRFKKGGAIDDKKAMVLSQIKEVHHHADELAKVLANMDTVDAWVVGKMERATTDLSDITHYLDGTTEYAKGGMIKEGNKVIYKGEERTVYSLYPKGMASLCLIDEDGYEYEDVEEDYQVSIKDLTPVKGSKKKNKQGIDLFEDYQDIPTKVQKVLDKYQEDIEYGDYKGLEKENVALIINNPSEKNQHEIYVGITRAKQNLKIYIII